MDPSAGLGRAVVLKDAEERCGMMVRGVFTAPMAGAGSFSSLITGGPPESLPLSVLCREARGVVSSSIVCNRASSGVVGFNSFSLDGVDGSLAISCTVSNDRACPPMPLAAGRWLLRSNLLRSSVDDGEALLCEMFEAVESCSTRRFPAQGGMFCFSVLGTLADGSGRAGEGRRVWGVGVGAGVGEARGLGGGGGIRLEGWALFKGRLGLTRSWLVFRL